MTATAQRPTIVHDGAVMKIAVMGPSTARLFGLPFLLIGAYLGYYLVLGIFYLLTGQADWGEMLPGTLILILFTAAFLVPGWLILFARAHVAIDRNARTVTYVRDLRVHQLRETRPLSDFDRIEVDAMTSSSNQSRVRGYKVELAAESRKNVLVALMDDGDEAVSFAGQLGGLLQLPVKDVRFVERDPDE